LGGIFFAQRRRGVDVRCGIETKTILLSTIVLASVINGCQAKRTEVTAHALKSRVTFSKPTEPESKLFPTDIQFKPSLINSSSKDSCIFATSWTFSPKAEMWASNIRPHFSFYILEKGMDKDFRKIPSDRQADDLSFALELPKGKSYEIKAVLELKELTNAHKILEEKNIGHFNIDLEGM
jgi:hypothetical protein